MKEKEERDARKDLTLSSQDENSDFKKLEDALIYQ